jgi:hypothetical protein
MRREERKQERKGGCEDCPEGRVDRRRLTERLTCKCYKKEDWELNMMKADPN